MDTKPRHPQTPFEALGLDAEPLRVVPGKELGRAALTAGWGGRAGDMLPLQRLTQNKRKTLLSLCTFLHNIKIFFGFLSVCEDSRSLTYDGVTS